MKNTKNTLTENNFMHSQLMIAGLQKPAAYPLHSTIDIQLLQTHSAWVLLTGEYAYKIKKPVNFGFLDFSSLAKRHQFCEKEVELNRRFAPQIYLSVENVYGEKEHPMIGSSSTASGKPVLDYAIKMRQFAADHLLSNLAEKKLLTVNHIDQLIKLVGDLHLSAKIANNESIYGTTNCVEHWMIENFKHIIDHLNDENELARVNLLRALVVCHSTLLEEIFEQRKNNCMIRDCHGDLHLGNLTLIDSQVIAFDCIEFNDELRWIDVISEVAFLLMDLKQHDYPEFANRLLNGYLQITGDYAGVKVLNYYLAYRAIVRAKVALLRRHQTRTDSAEYLKASNEYRRYIQFAENCFRQQPARLIVTFGLSGSGKSTVAQALCEKRGFIQIRSDVERKRTEGLSAKDKSSSSLNSGLYSTNKTQSTYEILLQHAEQVIDSGYSVLLDATYLRREHRTQAYQLSVNMGVEFIIIHCVVAEEILQQRIVERQKTNQDASEATLEVLQQQQKDMQILSVLEKSMSIEVDTSQPDHFEKLLESVQIKTADVS